MHAGWSNPPTKQWIKNHAPEYKQLYSDFFKLWHYKMDILPRCTDPVNNAISGEALSHPARSFYPAGSFCAKDFSRQSCFSSGESGSPLIAQAKLSNSMPEQWTAIGILSFVKSCDVFSFGTRNPAQRTGELVQNSENPAVYTELSCYLPWVAEQYGMRYSGGAACSPAAGSRQPSQPCRNTPSSLVELFTGERKCKLPFYYRDRLYHRCVLFEEDGFVYPVYRCPTRSVTTKINGTNSYAWLQAGDGLCPSDPTDPTSPLDPADNTCSPFQRRDPFSQCKNDCPGGEQYL